MDKYKDRGRILLVILFLVVTGIAAGPLYAYDLSADTIMMEGDQRQDGKIYIKGDKYRIQREGEQEYIILRHDLGVMWIVIPEEKAYVELPLDPKKTPKIREKNSGEVSRKLIGTEQMEGRTTNKYEITVKEGSKKETFYQWTAPDIDFPIKTAAREGEWVVEFRNIKTGVPDSLFEIPEGYERAKVAPKAPVREQEPAKKLRLYYPSSQKRR